MTVLSRIGPDYASIILSNAEACIDKRIVKKQRK